MQTIIVILSSMKDVAFLLIFLPRMIHRFVSQVVRSVYKREDEGRRTSHFGGTYNKIGTIQRRLAWPLRKDDTQNREAFHIFFLCLLVVASQPSPSNGPNYNVTLNTEIVPPASEIRFYFPVCPHSMRSIFRANGDDHQSSETENRPQFSLRRVQWKDRIHFKTIPGYHNHSREAKG